MAHTRKHIRQLPGTPAARAARFHCAREACAVRAALATVAFWGLWSASLLSGAPVRAEPGARVLQAERLYEDAVAALARGDLALACRNYDQSQRLDPQLGTELHLADCLEKQGKLASAWLHFRAAAMLAAERNEAGADEPRELVARRRADQLMPRLSTLRIIVPHPVAGLIVMRDGLELPQRAWAAATAVDGGEHVIRVTAPGYTPWARTLAIAQAEQHEEVLVPDLVREPVAVASPLAAETTAIDGGSAVPMQTIGYIVGAAGLVTAGIGIAFGLATLANVAKRDQLCPMDVCRDEAERARVEALTREAKTTSRAANVLMIAGGVATSVGIAALLLAPREPEPRVSVGFAASPQAAEVTLSGAF